MLTSLCPQESSGINCPHWAREALAVEDPSASSSCTWVVQRGGAGMALLCSTSGSTQDWLSLLHTGAEVLQGTGGGSCESWDGGQAPDKASLEAIAAEWEDR